jgi:hypothetical protein
VRNLGAVFWQFLQLVPLLLTGFKKNQEKGKADFGEPSELSMEFPGFFIDI